MLISKNSVKSILTKTAATCFYPTSMEDGYSCRVKHTLLYRSHCICRRCSKCGYEESVTAYTVFKYPYPINKAFRFS
ncbi:hypothetical protein CS542_09430 [Pedobacter sp. IW39]|nr:hypothetical protein CS542_09430 [Pedobacter sp. IW39]